MGRIQSNIGLITGTNIQSTVDQLIAISAQPRDRLQLRIKSYQSQQVAINELTALVIGVQLQSNRLGSAAALKSTTTTSSLPDVLKVRATGSPTAGEYAIRILQTAQTSAAASNTFTSVSDTVEAGEFVVRTGGFVDGSIGLDDLRGGTGVSRGRILITDRSGASREVDLSSAVTIDDVIKQINNTSGILVNAKADGDRIVLSDLTGLATSNLKVEEVGEGRTAADLGLSGINVSASIAAGDDIAFLGASTRLSSLSDGRGVGFVGGNDLSVTLKDGSTLAIDLNSTKAPSTVGQLLAAINGLDATKLEARIQANGDGIELIDKTTGSGSFAATGKVADQLGFSGIDGSSGTLSGPRLQSALQGPLLSSILGGQGIGTAGTIEIQNRAGVSTSVDLAGATSLRQVIDRINQANAGVTATLNRSRTGISLQDTTGSSLSNLRIQDGDANNTATKLKIVADVASNSVDSQSLGFQFISEATELSKLNQGRGVRSGSFTITDSAGQISGINLAQIKAKTLGDVIHAINETSIGVEARLNDSGDGFVLIDTAGGNGRLTIADSQNGNAALDLGIRGSAKDVTVGATTQQQIDGSQTFRLTLDGTESLNDLVDKINESNSPLTASVLTSGPSTVRLLFSSRASGDVGRVVIDGDDVGLNVSTTATARNAILAIGGSSDTAGTIVQSNSNVFSNVVTGLELTAAGTATDVVQVSIASNNSNIEKNLQLFVDQFNKVREKIEKETVFDSQNNVTGQLFGSSEILRVERTLTNLISSRTFGTGSVRSLEQLGLSLNETGKLQFDKEKLNKLLETNAADVESFLTKEESGFSARAKKALDNLVGVKNGALVNRTQALQRQVENGNARITSLNIRLENERNRLLKQFYGMEDVIAKLKNNSSAISNLQYISA